MPVKVALKCFFESDEVCETSYKDRGGNIKGRLVSPCPRSDAGL